MRSRLQIAITAAVLMLVAGSTAPAGAEPWVVYHSGRYAGHAPRAGTTVYFQPGNPAYGPLIVVSRTYPGYWPTEAPTVVRAVRLHHDEGPSGNRTTKRDANATSGRPSVGLQPPSAHDSSSPATQSGLDASLRALVVWLAPALSLWADP
jgi:hypothetical protein